MKLNDASPGTRIIRYALIFSLAKLFGGTEVSSVLLEAF